jgi:hypothetical protein
MKVLCINNVDYTYIIVGNWYEVDLGNTPGFFGQNVPTSTDTYKLVIFHDRGKAITHNYPSKLFKTLDQIREDKLNHI